MKTTITSILLPIFLIFTTSVLCQQQQQNAFPDGRISVEDFLGTLDLEMPPDEQKAEIGGMAEQIEACADMFCPGALIVNDEYDAKRIENMPHLKGHQNECRKLLKDDLTDKQKSVNKWYDYSLVFFFSFSLPLSRFNPARLSTIPSKMNLKKIRYLTNVDLNTKTVLTKPRSVYLYVEKEWL